MNYFQPISSASSPWSKISRRCREWRRKLLFWLEEQPTSLFRMSSPAKNAVVICYTCRRRVSEQELAAGLHNHEQAAAAASGTHAGE